MLIKYAFCLMLASLYCSPVIVAIWAAIEEVKDK